MENLQQSIDTCGGNKKPTFQGSPNAGQWYCENDTDWVWVEEIGKRLSLSEVIENLKKEIKIFSK